MKNIFKKLNIYHLLLGIIMLGTVVLLTALTMKKEGMHIDEYLTYGLADQEFADGHGRFDPETGIRFNAADVYDAYFYPDDLSLKNVWLNQASDVHPPLYYLFFHIFILVTHHFLGLKTAVLMQIGIHLINICLIWLVLKEMLSREYEALLGTVLYAFLPIVLGNVLFIRMYVMLASFILALTLLFVRGWNRTDRKTFYVKLGLLSILGTLTHYYFLIYLFYCCAVWGIYILSKRRWKELVTFLATMTVSGAVTLAVFPYILKHIFAGNVGQKSIGNLLSLSTLKQNAIVFMQALDNIYGGYLLAVLAAAAAVLLFRYVVRDGDTAGRNGMNRWLIVLIPCVLFLLTVTKIAIYPVTRYISPSYAIFIVLLMGLFDRIVTSPPLSGYDWFKWMAGALMTGLILNNGYKAYTWPELYTEAKECVDAARKYGVDNECIYVSNVKYRSLASYPEFIQYQNMTFILDPALDQLYTEDYSGYDHVVMYFDKNLGQEKIDEILEQMIRINPGLEEYHMVQMQHGYSYNAMYYLE